jgi:sugar phosphate isomerase/epimerase
VKLAVSNIAWPANQDEAIAKILCDLGVGGIEVAPTKIWPAPLTATDEQIDQYRRFWEARGIAIVASQALLFGKPELTLFENSDTRSRTLDYLKGIVRVCARLGAGALVFGSPVNRRVGERDPAAAWHAAVDFFGQLGESAFSEGTAIVMEANPPEYKADFATHASDAIRLVRAVNHPGFRLHLDSACMTMAGDPVSLIGESMDILRHFHVSEPFLGMIGLDTTGSVRVDHAQFAGELRKRGYAHWISIEMRESRPFAVESLGAAIRFTQKVYGIAAERRH